MEMLKAALEGLDEMISVLEDRLGLESTRRAEEHKKQADLLKISRTREAHVLAAAQKVAARLDDTMRHVEQVLRD